MPTNTYLGIYPTLQSLAVQAAILIAILAGLVWTFVVRPRRLAAPAVPATPPGMSAPARRRREAAGV